MLRRVGKIGELAVGTGARAAGNGPLQTGIEIKESMHLVRALPHSNTLR